MKTKVRRRPSTLTVNLVAITTPEHDEPQKTPCDLRDAAKPEPASDHRARAWVAVRVANLGDALGASHRCLREQGHAAHVPGLQYTSQGAGTLRRSRDGVPQDR